MLTCGSPQLIAAYRVLRRQSVPWHPPCALVRLILPVHVDHYFLRLLRVVINKDCCCLFLPCAVFKVRLRLSRLKALPPECLKYQLIVDPSKRYRNQSFCCQTPLARWPTLSTPCVVVADVLASACRSFRLPATDFSVVDLGYERRSQTLISP